MLHPAYRLQNAKIFSVKSFKILSKYRFIVQVVIIKTAYFY